MPEFMYNVERPTGFSDCGIMWDYTSRVNIDYVPFMTSFYEKIKDKNVHLLQKGNAGDVFVVNEKTPEEAKKTISEVEKEFINVMIENNVSEKKAKQNSLILYQYI